MQQFITTALLIGCLTFLAGGLAVLVPGVKPGRFRIFCAYTALIGSASWLLASVWGLYQSAASTWYTIGFNWLWTWQLDSLSSFFLMLVAVAGVLAAIYSMGYAQAYDANGGRVLGSAFNLFLLSLGLVLTANGVFPFLLSWEFMAVTSLFLVGLDHTQPKTRQAAFVYAVVTHCATALLTVAFLIVASRAGWDFTNWQACKPAGNWYHLTYALFIIGFGCKAGLAPLHIWLPRAHPAAPAHISALMSGVMVKVAIYGLIKVSFVWLATPSLVWGVVLLGLGVISALLGALYAAIDQDIKGVLAYSTIENVGLLVSGIGVAILYGQVNAKALALGFVLYHTLGHAVFKMLLFFGAGAIQHAAHTRQLDKLGGLIKYMPITAGLMLVGVATIAALPPLAGFVSEYTLMQVLFGLTNSTAVEIRCVGVLAMVALALTAGLVLAAMVRFYGVVFLGRPRTQLPKMEEPPLSMRLPQGFLAVACVLIGLAARPILTYTTRLAANLLTTTLPDTPITPVSPPTLLAAMAGIGFILWAITVGLTKRYHPQPLPIRRAIPWGCGHELTAAMQYSALGLAEPVRFIWRRLLRLDSAVLPVNASDISNTSEAGNVINANNASNVNNAGHFRLTIQVPGENLLYRPLRDRLWKLATQLRRLQAGNLQLYLIYLFITLALLLLFAR